MKEEEEATILLNLIKEPFGGAITRELRPDENIGDKECKEGSTKTEANVSEDEETRSGVMREDPPRRSALRSHPKKTGVTTETTLPPVSDKEVCLNETIDKERSIREKHGSIDSSRQGKFVCPQEGPSSMVSEPFKCDLVGDSPFGGKAPDKSEMCQKIDEHGFK